MVFSLGGNDGMPLMYALQALILITMETVNQHTNWYAKNIC